MAFQLSGFQRNAYQMLSKAATSSVVAAGKIKKRLRKNARIKAHADDLAERYARLQQSEIIAPAVELVEIIKPYSKASASDLGFKLPEVKEIDFEALAANAKAKKDFVAAVKLAAAHEEEEMALILMMAVI